MPSYGQARLSGRHPDLWNQEPVDRLVKHHRQRHERVRLLHDLPKAAAVPQAALVHQRGAHAEEAGLRMDILGYS